MRERIAAKATKETQRPPGNPNRPHVQQESEAVQEKNVREATLSEDISPEVLKRVLYGGGALDQ